MKYSSSFGITFFIFLKDVLFMEKIMVNVLFFMFLMFVIFFIDYVFFMKRKLNDKGKRKKEDIMEINYLVGKFKLDRKKILYKPVALWCALINAFIMSFVSTVVFNIKLHIAWQLLIAFALLFGLIYSLYEIYGRHLVRKGWKKKNE